MTLPDEERWAVKKTRNFLFSLMSNKETPSPISALWLRRKAYDLSKHYPSDDRIDEIFDNDLWLGRSG